MKNYMEEVVDSQLDEVLRNMDMCKCEKCRMDITAITLNSLPPKYIVSEIGELYSKANSLIRQFEVDVTAAIAKAAVIVKMKPRHDG